jgi:hypothetical protein
MQDTDTTTTTTTTNVAEYWNAPKFSIRQWIKFHLAQQNITYQADKHWVDTLIVKPDKMVIANRRKRDTHPILSIAYSNAPTHLLSCPISKNAYKFKEIPEETSFYLHRISVERHVVLPSTHYYGCIVSDTDDNLNVKSNINIHMIHVWERDGTEMGKDVCETEPEEEEEESAIQFTKCSVETIASKIYKNDSSTVNDLLYSTQSAIHDLISTSVSKCDDNDNDNSTHHITYILKTVLDYGALINKYSKATVDDLLSLVKEGMDVEESNRFYRNKLLTGVMSKDICYWILNESFKSKLWQKSPYVEYDKYLKVESIPSVLNFMLFIANFWLMDIRRHYGLEEDIKMNMKDLFICNYTDALKPTTLATETHTEGNSLVITIQLNCPVDFISEGIHFTDGAIVLQQGDMLIHHGKKNRSNGGVTNGEKFVVVIFLDLEF